MNMFRKLSITALCLFGAGALLAQQAPLFSQYMHNEYVLNPAVAGSKTYTPIRSVIRSQWTGIEGQPNTQTLSIHGRLKRHTGIGGYIFNDNIGPISQTGVSASYAYHMQLGETSQLSLGLGAMAYLYKLKTNELHFDSQGSTDNVLNEGNFKAFYPNFSFGAFYYSEKFYAGISVPELMQTKITSSEEFFIMKQVRHYYLMSGYTFHMGEKYKLEPSTLVKYVHGAPVELDLSAKFTAYDKFSLGASYRSNDAVVAFLGFTFQERWHLGYSYDITMTELSKYTRGSHELMLGYDIVKTVKQPSL
jgi:type IX secretion system PorP/SprF family membrane protein